MLMKLGKLMVEVPFIPTHQHKKGGLYMVLLNRVRYCEGSALMVVYMDAKGDVWARFSKEFYEPGRFVSLVPDSSTYTEYEDVTDQYTKLKGAGLPADDGDAEAVHEDPDAGC